MKWSPAIDLAGDLKMFAPRCFARCLFSCPFLIFQFRFRTRLPVRGQVVLIGTAGVVLGGRSSGDGRLIFGRVRGLVGLVLSALTIVPAVAGCFLGANVSEHHE